METGEEHPNMTRGAQKMVCSEVGWRARQG
jgi:hypothetical protein